MKQMVPALFLLVILLLSKGIIGQKYILKSDPPNLGGTEVCPRNIRLICMGIRVLVLYWNATTTDGREHVLASHSGGQENYQVETHFRGISYNVTPDFIFPYQDKSFFDVNATIIIELSSVVKQNIIGFSCGSTSHTLSSNLYSTNVTVIGFIELTSNTGKLSGMICHSSVTLTCNAMLCSEKISWYSDDEVLGTYVFNVNDDFPQNISSNFEIELKLLSGFLNTSTYNFNSTLLADVNDLYQFQGSNITCGSFLERSNAFVISNFTVVAPDPLDVIYTAIYDDEQGKLIQILIQWNNSINSELCDVIYKIEIKNSDSILVFNNTLTSKDCIDYVCFENVTTPRDNMEAYHVLVSASYMNRITDVNSKTIGTSVGTFFGNELEMKNCSSTFTCSALSDEDCLFQYGSDPYFKMFLGTYTFQSNTTYIFTFNFSFLKEYVIQISKLVNSTNIVQRHFYNIGNTNMDTAYIITGYIAFGIGIILLFFGCILCVSSLRVWKYDSWVFSFMYFIFIIVTTIFLLSLALWISYHTSTRDFCGLHLQKSALAISAMVISFLLAISTSVVCVGFCILYGNAKMVMNRLDQSSATDSKKEEEKIKEEFILIEKSSLCSKCSKMNYAFVPAQKVELPVCNICWKTYWEENIEIFKIKNIHELMLIVNKKGSKSADLYKYMFTYCVGYAGNRCTTCGQIIYGLYFMAANFSKGEEMCDICYMLSIRKYHLRKKLENQNIDLTVIELTPDMFIDSEKTTEEVTATTNQLPESVCQQKMLTEDK